MNGRNERGQKCRYSECVVQEIAIASLARQGGHRRFFFKHTKTEIAPIDANGDILEDVAVSVSPDNPGHVAPEVPELIRQAEARLGKTLEQLLNAEDGKTGYSVHAFGCADECDCVRRQEKIKLPDGTEIDDPGQLVDGGLPPHRNAVPGEDQPVAVVEKRVVIPGRGTFLLTYEIRLFGSVRRFKGECRPRRE